MQAIADNLDCMETFAERLTRVIAQKGLTQRQLSKRSGLKESAISEFVAGKRRIYLDQAQALARGLGVTLDYLCEPSDTFDIGPLTPEEKVLIVSVRTFGWDLGRISDWAASLARPRVEWSDSGRQTHPAIDLDRDDKGTDV